MDDVVKFLETKYPSESCRLLKAQLSLLNKAPKDSRHSDGLKQFALSVYFLSPNAYKKISKVFRLPSKSTLARFTRRWTINPGFNDYIFNVIECRAKLLKEEQKDCILCLDEISLKPRLFYDISRDKIIGFQTGNDKDTQEIARSALIVMARGITSSWKQPIAYFFYKTSATADDLKDILFESVRKLRQTGLNVRGVVSDQGANFYKLVKSTLQLTEDNPTFYIDEMKLVYLFDVPNLLRSTRNMFFSHIFTSHDGETRKGYLEMMYNVDKTRQFRLAPRLTNDHVYPNNFQKMEVGLASQVFSHSVAVAMHTYIDFNVLPKGAIPTANFILRMNQLFGVLNSSNSEHFEAFMGSDKQKILLKEMDDVFQNLQVLNTEGKNVTKKLKFLFGWRMTINSIFTLWESLKTYNARNLNKDCIENFFDQVRNCCNARNPTPIQFSRAFKKIFVQRFFDGSESPDSMDDVYEVFMDLTPEFTETCNDVLSMATPVYTPLKVFTSDYKNIETPEGNALVCVTEYLLKKSLLQHSCDVCQIFFNNPDSFVSEETCSCKLKAYDTENSPFGGVTVPSKDIVEYMLKLESIFVSKFNEIAFREGIGMRLKKEFSKIVYIHPYKDFPLQYFLSLYTRVRIYRTLKFINDNIRTGGLNKNNKLDILKR